MKNALLSRTFRSALLIGMLGCLGTGSSQAQYTFNCGSTGGDGALNVTTNTTLQLPADGIFNYTTITIASNATLKFTPNVLNTPVYLLAAGDVTINGTIDLSGTAGTALLGGAGGPGGFAGGNPGVNGLPAGDGHGPGAGRAGSQTSAPYVGAGGYGSPGNNPHHDGTNDGAAYGSVLLVPLVGGSGGGGMDGLGGNGGGGALLVASNTRIDANGTVLAASPNRGAGYGANVGCGSGGAIRLVAPIVAGSGYLNAGGGTACCGETRMAGGAGRIRIDCVDRRALALRTSGTAADSYVGTLAVATVGANMVAIPTNAPHLNVTRVAGTDIPSNTRVPFFFMLPPGASTNQTVTVQASNFGTQVPIRVVLTPDNGPSSFCDTNIDNTLGPASVTIPVTLPASVQVQVSAWTR